MFEFLQILDWPNLLAGAVIASVSSALVWFARGVYGYYVAAKDLPYPIWGHWFSAEFDPKGATPAGDHGIELSGRNTFLHVSVKRRLGRKVVVKALGPMEGLPQVVPTKWVAHAHLVQGDTLVGTWRSTVKHTNRHGTAILKFLDYGRAVGYWVGSGGTGHPVYGYWIMSRSKEDIENIARTVLERTEFKTLDVASFVIQLPPPTARQ